MIWRTIRRTFAKKYWTKSERQALRVANLFATNGIGMKNYENSVSNANCYCKYFI